MSQKIQTVDDAITALTPPPEKRVRAHQWRQDGYVRTPGRVKGTVDNTVRWTADIHYAGQYPEELVLLTAQQVAEIRAVVEELRDDNNDMRCRMSES